MEEENEELAEVLHEIVNDLIEDYDYMAVASLLMINAFMIYGQALDRENYKELMTDIFKQSEQFSSPRSRVLH